MIKLLLITISLLIGGCSTMFNNLDKQKLERIFKKDYSWCRDNGWCGMHQARFLKTANCMCRQEGWDAATCDRITEVDVPYGDTPDPVLMPHVTALSGIPRAKWFGTRCTWIACEVYSVGLCKGVFHPPSNIILPATDDKAFQHEVVHYLLHNVTGDLDPSHKSKSFNICGFPMLFCPDEVIP